MNWLSSGHLVSVIVVSFFIFFLAACGGSGGGSSTPAVVVVEPVTDTGSNGGNNSGNGIGEEDNDVTSQLNISLHATNNLIINAQVTSEKDMKVILQFDSELVSSREVSSSELKKNHEFVIVGLRANTEYRFKTFTTDSNNNTTESEVKRITTGPLPNDAPVLELLASNDSSYAGITFFASNGASSRFYGVDEYGEYVWYLADDEISMSGSPTIKSLGNGQLMLLLAREVRIIDLTGAIIKRYTLPAYHHDVSLLGNGHLLVLTNETATLNGEVLKGDKILEVNEQGNVVWEWSSFEHLDTNRFPGALANRVNNGQKDWTHSNALFYQSHDDSILLSSRSQSWVINIDHSSGDILWIMGKGEGADSRFQNKFFALNSGNWMASQHTPMLTGIGEVLIYDNRNESELPGNIYNSRAVRFNLNTEQMTATQTWEYIAPKYTQSLGDVDELMNGNILVTAGGPGSHGNAHIIEVTGDMPAEVVWELRALNTSIYRAERINWNEILAASMINNANSNDENNTGDISDLIDVTNCHEAENFVDTNNPENYIDYNMDGLTNADIFGEALTPKLAVTCDSETLLVDTNGVTNFDWINLGQGAAQPIASDYHWVLPRNPEISGELVDIPLLGPIAITVTGIQIFGPNENAADNFANPVTDGLLNYCGGHTRDYHFHERAHCFFEWSTMGGAQSLLEKESAGVVIGYAFDGFPIMAPWECSDLACSSVVKVESSYRYIGSGDYANENAWNYHQYEESLSPLDECNGMVRPDGTYAYYATDDWPYYLACYKGPTHLLSENNARINPSAFNRP